ncbi:MAG: hypothetical protein ACTSWR_10270 [Candidatus Helarchaeota archaeon]
MEAREDLIVVDIGECIGCGNCIMVCHLNDRIDDLIKYGKKLNKTRFKVENGVINRSSICFNCTDAPCVKACDKNILKKDETGLVYIDLDIYSNEKSEKGINKLKICHDCAKMCIDACPTNELFLVNIKSEGAMFTVPLKCDLCDGDPQCAKVCPTGAIKLVNILKTNLENKKSQAEILAKVSNLID